MSPKKYIVKEKLDKAKMMLTKTDIPITQIAASVGYPDVLAFSKVFSAYEKMSPSKYREAMQKVDYS